MEEQMKPEYSIPDGVAGLEHRTFHSEEMARAMSVLHFGTDQFVKVRYVTEWRDLDE